MSDKPWKQAERKAAEMIGGMRYPANLGLAVDCESSWCVAQVKHVKVCSLAKLEGLALEAERQGTQKRKIGAVVIHRRAGRGKPTPRLVVLTESMFREMSGPLPSAEDGYVVEPSEVLASYVNLSPKILKARLAAAGRRDSDEFYAAFYAARPEAKSFRARIEKEFNRLLRAGTPWDRQTIFAALTEPLG